MEKNYDNIVQSTRYGFVLESSDDMSSSLQLPIKVDDLHPALGSNYSFSPEPSDNQTRYTLRLLQTFGFSANEEHRERVNTPRSVHSVRSVMYPSGRVRVDGANIIIPT